MRSASGHSVTQRLGLLFHRQRFSCKRGFLNLQVDGFNQTRISGNFIAGAQQDDIADHDVTRWNDDFLTITQGRCRRRRHLAQRFQGSLAPIFLAETQQRSKEDDECNCDGLRVVAQKKRERRGHQQDGDQDVFELSEKNAPGRDSVRSFKFIGTVLDQTAGRLSLV